MNNGVGRKLTSQKVKWGDPSKLYDKWKKVNSWVDSNSAQKPTGPQNVDNPQRELNQSEPNIIENKPRKALPAPAVHPQMRGKQFIAVNKAGEAMPMVQTQSGVAHDLER